MKYLLSLLLFLQCEVIYCQTSWFDENAISCIVLLEKDINNQLIPHGVGFLLYNYDTPDSYYVITCEHVLRNRSIHVKIPADTFLVNLLQKEKTSSIEFGKSTWVLNGKNLLLKVDLRKDTTFIVNKELDIGVFRIFLYTTLIDNRDSSKHKVTSVTGIPKSSISKRKDTKLGDEIYFLGFPYLIGTEKGLMAQGQYAEEISNPLLRTGTIAYISNSSNEFLIDALSYSGNSGSPVFTRQGLSNPASKLIGIVKGHLPSQESDNMGLARAVWIDDIINLVKQFKN